MTISLFSFTVTVSIVGRLAYLQKKSGADMIFLLFLIGRLTEGILQSLQSL